MEDREKKNKKSVLRGRICVLIRGKLESPLLAGSGEDNLTDQDLLIDPYGTPYLPGSSLAGALREYMRNILQSDLQRWLGLFGGERENSEEDIPELSKRQSRIFVYDTYLMNASVIERDGVRLDERKTVADMAKFSVQAVETGADFLIRLEIWEREEESGDKIERLQELDYDLILNMVSGLICGELRVGARSHRGFGRLGVDEVKIAKFNLRSREDYKRWLEWDWDQKDSFYQNEVLDLKQCLNKPKIEHCLTVPLKIEHTLMIRQYSDVKFGKEGFPDSGQLCLSGEGKRKAVVPGSSWAGAVRSRIAEITVSLSHCENWEAAQQRLAPFFGSWGIERDQTKIKSSSVIFEESVVRGGHGLPVTRNAIDRFTGGTVNGALFTEVVCVGGELELTVRWPDRMKDKEALIGLLLWAVRDLQDGLLAVGGETSVGRGIFMENGKVSLDGMPIKNPEVYSKAALEWCRRQCK